MTSTLRSRQCCKRIVYQLVNDYDHSVAVRIVTKSYFLGERKSERVSARVRGRGREKEKTSKHHKNHLFANTCTCVCVRTYVSRHNAIFELNVCDSSE